MSLQEIERRIRQMRWPDPSEELRARVLEQTTMRPQIVTWSDRVWFSRTWRLSMAAATIGLLSVQVWPGSRSSVSIGESPMVMAEVQMIEEIVRQAGLPAEFAAALARRTVAGRAPVAERLAVMDQVFDQEER